MFTDEEKKDSFFPYATVRNVQHELIATIKAIIISGRAGVLHAPTGLGKTVSALGPALAVALEKKLTVFFLTSRHTQHKIAIETLQDIKKTHMKGLIASDMIGKRWMCLQNSASQLRSSEFNEYCKHLRENHECEFFERLKSGTSFSVDAKRAIDDLKKRSPCHSSDIFSNGEKKKLCPYELATALATRSHVIVADYYYLFHPRVRETFLTKMKKELENAIIIVDEAHNLPARIRDLASEQISSYVILSAIKEAKKHSFPDLITHLATIQNALVELSKNLGVKDEILVRRETFMDQIGSLEAYKEIIGELEDAANIVREMQRSSFLGSVSTFLSLWMGEDEGYIRIISLKQGFRSPLITLQYKCLDPSIITSDVFSQSYSTIMMSGTLTPPEMYKDILGCKENTVCKEFENPFPKKNRLALIVPKTTTKYSLRSESQYKNIAKQCIDISEAIPGNVIIFFPSYAILNAVGETIKVMVKKTVIEEVAQMGKDEKFELLEKFKSYKKSGAILLAVTSANFAEGIDLPGDLLKGVIVVGLPLQRPDLETKGLIAYYDRRFQKGWDYGYVYPAFNKTLQSAGRCIRSEEDKGVIVFLDERYAWPNYKKYFPVGSNVQISADPAQEIKSFFINNTGS